jgi:hypothetical protein
MNDDDDDDGEDSLLEIAELETFAGLARKTVAFVRSHRTLNVIAIWALFMTVNHTLNQPLEWFVLLGYSLLMLLRTRRQGVSSLFVYVVGVSTADYVVSAWFSPEVTENRNSNCN